MSTKLDCSVVAVFKDSSDAQSAVSELKSSGINSDNIFTSTQDAAGSKTAASSGYAETTSSQGVRHQGGIKGWFHSLFGSDEHADRRGYEKAVAGGYSVVSVDTTEANAGKVSDILNRFSPVDVHTDDFGVAQGISTSDTYSAGVKSSASDLYNAEEELGMPVTTTGSAGAASAGLAGAGSAAKSGLKKAVPAAGQAIPVVDEELKVGKREVSTGGVRVYSRVVERPVEEDIQLRQERVQVDREPVNRPAKESDFRAGQEQVIEVQEFAEEPVVSKQARVVEEVRVNKDTTERTEKIRDTVRRSEVSVENLDQTNARGTTGQTYSDADFRNHFSTNYGTSGGSYEDYAPAYRYGSDVANDPRYRGRSYNEIEPELRQAYGQKYPNSAWDRMKDSVRYGWDKVTGKASSATSSR